MKKEVDDTPKKLRLLTFKITLLTLIIIAVVALAMTVTPEKPNTPSLSEAAGRVVKGGGGLIVQSTNKETSSFRSKVLGAKDAAVKKTTTFTSGAVTMVKKKAADVAYTFTIKPLLDNFQKLPKDQQKEARGQICGN
ncbi:MAG: hypothetical protein ACMG6E_09925 [Candidatus Roizmanbacteria bacterium]